MSRKYSQAFVRAFSGSSQAPFKAPRFTQTLKEASKPPLEKSHVISRPFGLDAPKVVNQKGAQTSLYLQLFGAEARELRQKRLDHDIAHLPFYESKSFANTNGKIFTPPVSFFRREKAKFFPDFHGTSLDGKSTQFSHLLANKVSIVRIYSTVSGERCSDTYFNVSGEDYLTGGFETFKKEYPMSQIMDLNLPQNRLKRFVVSVSKSNIKRMTPVERHPGYFILPQAVFPFDIKQTLYCDNMCSGYIYILDHQGRIRWATSGYASDEERDLMWKCVRGLEKELRLLLV